MLLAQSASPTELAGVDRLALGFARLFETFDVGPEICAEDIFFDLNMPVWRFQLQGRDAFAEQLKRINRGPVQVEIGRTIPTLSGFVSEHVEHQLVDSEDISARKIWVCDVEDGLIVHATCYCTGEWDDALRARHAVEAPMVRP